MPSAKRPAKVQRWMDVIVALLRFRYPISFETLSHEVPAYADPEQTTEARMRMFERDKDELRTFGVPIETVTDPSGVSSTYRLQSRAFYLPYLHVAEDGAPPSTPKRLSGLGYQGLPVLAFEPDELVMIARAANRVQQMQHPSLAADAATAVRKLAFDVPFVDGHAHEVMLQSSQDIHTDVLDILDTAVRRRKRLDIEYRSMERNANSERGIEPYGLIFLSGNWYLVARDITADALRHFRVSRISHAVMNPLKSQTPDFATPAGFDLWSHTKSRQAWELGDDDATQVTVRFDQSDRFAAAGAELGEAAGDDENCRRFVVRRPDAFVRWLLSFGGTATPVSPPSIGEALHALATSTATLYAEPSR
ncbi:MAG: WYL domain-containing protein [Gemmatimonadetes bacterium]|nr:WYL domain-containing protein [Gemmatimonadota bacterium]